MAKWCLLDKHLNFEYKFMHRLTNKLIFASTGFEKVHVKISLRFFLVIVWVVLYSRIVSIPFCYQITNLLVFPAAVLLQSILFSASHSTKNALFFRRNNTSLHCRSLDSEYVVFAFYLTACLMDYYKDTLLKVC